MEVNQSGTAGGSLHIATDVVEKISRLAAMEVDGVFAVSFGRTAIKTLLDKISPQSPVQVVMKDDVADITVNLVVDYGAKIAEVSEKVQQNVKTSVQSMAQITVAKVDVVVNGIHMEEAVPFIVE
jgi:uncharacterized alkaline shock family protein YloU